MFQNTLSDLITKIEYADNDFNAVLTANELLLDQIHLLDLYLLNKDCLNANETMAIKKLVDKMKVGE